MEQSSSKKWLWIGLGVLLFLLLLLGFFLSFGRGTTVGKTIGKVLPFGASSQTVSQGNTIPSSSGNGTQGGGLLGNGGGETTVPIFRQLANVPVAGAYALLRDGTEYVRYIEKETGHAYEVALESGATTQLSNTTIPRIAFAHWADNGNAVVLSSLEASTLLGRLVVKTQIGSFPLPNASSSLPVQTGNLQIDALPDDITALSVAPDGKDLFYLKKEGGGVYGSIFNLGTKLTRRVFESPFSEWTPQLLSDDRVILTTRPSGNVAGFSYLYDPTTQTLERIVREKNGLTTLGSALGTRVLYGENISGNITLGVYSSSGFVGDEGIVNHERRVPIITLPEKCAWLADGVRALCGSFAATGGLIPDLWYQGRLSFNDTFWLVNTDTSEVSFLADPKTEVQREFDVVDPIVSANEKYFIFTNKNDGTLWSLRLSQQLVATSSAPETSPAQNLSPAEMQDVQGSLPVPQSSPAHAPAGGRQAGSPLSATGTPARP